MPIITRKRLGRHLSSNLVGYLALFVALSTAPAYAALAIRSADIVNGEVKRVDIAGGAVDGSKIAQGSVAPGDLSPGAKSTVYFKQNKAFPGVGTTYAPYATVAVPKGNYVVYGHGLLNSNDADTQVWECQLIADGALVDYLEIVPLGANLAPGERESITLMAAVALGSSGDVTLQCKHDGGGANIGWPSVTAVRVASVVAP